MKWTVEPFHQVRVAGIEDVFRTLPEKPDVVCRQRRQCRKKKTPVGWNRKHIPPAGVRSWKLGEYEISDQDAVHYLPC